MLTLRASLCLAVLSGCALAHERALLEPPGDDEDGATEEEIPGDPADVPALFCAGALPAGDPVLIAADIHPGSVVVSPCGELAYSDGATTHLLDAAYIREKASMPGATQAEFSADGGWFRASDVKQTLLYDMRLDAGRVHPFERGGFVRLNAQSVPFACAPQGLALLVDGQLETRFPGADCAGDAFLSASPHGSSVLYRSADGRVRLADFATSEDRQLRLNLATYEWWPDHQTPLDLFHLSSDGRALVHSQAWDEDCGTATCRKSQGHGALLDLAHGDEIFNVQVALDPYEQDLKILEGPPGSHLMAVEGGLETTLLSFADRLVSSPYEGVAPLMLVPGRAELLGVRGSTSALELFGLGTSSEISPASASRTGWDTPTVRASRDGEVIAYTAYRSQRCAQDPTLNDCDQLVSDLVVWSHATGERFAYPTGLSPQPLWVGADGSLLFAGELVIGRASGESGEPIFEAAHLFLMGPDGKMRTKWSGWPLQVLELNDGFLVVVTQPHLPGQPRIERVSAAGEVTTLAEGPPDLPADTTLFAAVDAAEQRLVYTVAWLDASAEGGLRGQVYAGLLR